MNKTNLVITDALVRKMMSEHFAQYRNLTLRAVAHQGIDHRTFHLGDHMLVRLPSAENYAPQVLKEQQWLPVLAQYLDIPIPTPLHMVEPNLFFPRPWSIYQFIPGEDAQACHLSTDELNNLANDLGMFIRQLHTTPTRMGPPSGAHNFYRGCPLSVYDAEIKGNVSCLENIIDIKKALAIWEAALCSRWIKPDVWVHGDIAAGNLLIKKGKLAAVIDFGCMGVGDPSCDLMIAWTFFRGAARSIFKRILNLDLNTWRRARGWTLWKMSCDWVNMHDRSSPKAVQTIKIMNAVLNDF